MSSLTFYTGFAFCCLLSFVLSAPQGFWQYQEYNNNLPVDDQWVNIKPKPMTIAPKPSPAPLITTPATGATIVTLLMPKGHCWDDAKNAPFAGCTCAGVYAQQEAFLNSVNNMIADYGRVWCNNDGSWHSFQSTMVGRFCVDQYGRETGITSQNNPTHPCLRWNN